MLNSLTKNRPFTYTFLMMLTLLFFTSSIQASTDTTNIGISVIVQTPCQLSIGNQLSEPTISCQLSEPEFVQKISLPAINYREHTIIQHDGCLSIRASITAP